MTSPIEGRSFLDIKASVKIHKQVIPDLLAVHALTGINPRYRQNDCSESAEKPKVWTWSGRFSSALAAVDNSCWKTVCDICLAYYGQGSCRSLTEARQKTWTQKIAQRRSSAPPLSSLHQLTRLSDRITFVLSCRSPFGCMHWILIHQILRSHCMDGHYVKERIHCIRSLLPTVSLWYPGNSFNLSSVLVMQRDHAEHNGAATGTRIFGVAHSVLAKARLRVITTMRRWRLTLQNSIEMSIHYVSFQRKVCSK